MTREIKFRAWDGNLMHHFGLQDISANGAVTGSEHGCIDLYSDERKGNIMQYTGLKDKNGVEIYEGDIVRYKGFVDAMHTGTITRVVEYEPIFGFIPVQGGHSKPDIEVIGNIYENPELVK